MVVQLSVVSLISNISSLQAQRRLAESNYDLRRSFERLSSGLRINRASDDAAGLAISMGLSSASRVYGQGIRNVNDALSLLNVAQGSTEQLSGILMRMKELATSASNGTLTRTQRSALDTEAYELQREFNRITASTSFNGRSLLNANFGGLHIQAGYGQRGTLSFDLGNGLERSIGNGTFDAPFTVAGFYQDSQSGLLIVGDLNNDGYDDFFNLQDNSGASAVRLSNGDGTFRSVAVPDVSSASAGKLGDVNNDGILDLVTTAHVLIGNGDGSFRNSISLPGSLSTVQLGDVNNDGKLDIVGETGAAAVSIMLGAGNGTFSVASTVSISLNSFVGDLGDFNGDGNLDIVSADLLGSVSTYLGSGNGSFALGSTLSLGSGPSYVASTDFNHDGISDLAIAVAGSIRLYRGSSSGAFALTQTFGSAIDRIRLADLNGDGNLDLAAYGESDASAYLANGDGTFATTVASRVEMGGLGTSTEDFQVGDFNGDGVTDYVETDPFGGNLNIAFGRSFKSTTLERLNLMTKAGALEALGTIETAFNRVSKELGLIGAGQARLGSVLSTLDSTALNYEAANSRIIDVDVAAESASLSAKQILQNTAAAVLAQANQLPALAIQLLRI